MRFKPVALISLVGLVTAQNYGFIKCTQGCIRRAKQNNILALYECQKLCEIRNGLKDDNLNKNEGRRDSRFLEIHFPLNAAGK